MADAAVSFAIENVGNFLIQEAKFLSGVRGQVEEMQTELKWMLCFLKDAERRKGESDVIRNWVSEIREAAYYVEDLVEHYALKSSLRNHKGAVNSIKKYTCFINHIVETHKVGSGIEAIKAKLSNLRTRLQTYGIRELRVGGEEGSAARALATGRRKRQDYAHVVDHNIVGLDEKIAELVEHLLNVEEASVVCLYGMGGLGKTTTAKKVYTDSRIDAYFECHAWVYISQQFSHRQVWESILIQISNKKKNETEKMSDDELSSQICSIQKERRCLLVIDDIWNSQDWDELSPAFSYLEKDSRSKILLTSRYQNIVSHGVYRTSLDILNHKNSLELLKKTILSLGGSNHPLRESLSMEKSAGEMVKQCAGLPLAIVVLGGILATKHELAEWERVGDNIKLSLNRGEQKGGGGLASVLESSYQDLPYYLKSCFLYFSQHREDEEIKVTELIQRWIGEGFVSSSMEDEDETMEDVAEEYLNELVSRCVIQVGRRGYTGRVKTCKMHDLMRDLCISKAKEEGFAHTIDLKVRNEETIWEKVSIRRLCILLSDINRDKLGRSKLSSVGEISPQLRSIRFQDITKNMCCKELMLVVKKLKLVRVLELGDQYWYNDMIRRTRNLIHLRFLKLGGAKLPGSIGDLMCLQTLNLESVLYPLEISDSVWGMKQLRHLYLPRGYRGVCESSKQQVSNLQNLQTLVNFPPVNFDLVQNLVKLTNVRKLVIDYNWGGTDRISRSREIRFNRLQSLTFKSKPYVSYVDLEDITRSCPRLHKLVVNRRLTVRYPEKTSIWPSNLTKLVLEETKIDESHMRTLAKLQSLSVLFLKDDSFIGKEMIFHRNDFPKLHHLLAEGLVDLEAWSVRKGALPSLSCLEICWCKKLKSVADGSQYLKQLKELKVTNMPYSFKRRVEQDWVRVSDDAPSISFGNIDEPDPLELEFEKVDGEIEVEVETDRGKAIIL